MRKIVIWFDLVAYLGVYAYGLRHPQPGWAYVSGMAVGAAGFVLWLVARVQLGDSFSARPTARKLITGGLYARIRNPVYIFSTIALIGICLAMQWYEFGAVYVGFVSLVQWRRAKAEAAVLESAFGDQYRKYRAQTWF